MKDFKRQCFACHKTFKTIVSLRMHECEGVDDKCWRQMHSECYEACLDTAVRCDDIEPRNDATKAKTNKQTSSGSDTFEAGAYADVEEASDDCDRYIVSASLRATHCQILAVLALTDEQIECGLPAAPERVSVAKKPSWRQRKKQLERERELGRGVGADAENGDGDGNANESFVPLWLYVYGALGRDANGVRSVDLAALARRWSLHVDTLMQRQHMPSAAKSGNGSERADGGESDTSTSTKAKSKASDAVQPLSVAAHQRALRRAPLSMILAALEFWSLLARLNRPDIRALTFSSAARDAYVGVCSRLAVMAHAVLRASTSSASLKRRARHLLAAVLDGLLRVAGTDAKDRTTERLLSTTARRHRTDVLYGLHADNNKAVPVRGHVALRVFWESALCLLDMLPPSGDAVELDTMSKWAVQRALLFVEVMYDVVDRMWALVTEVFHTKAHRLASTLNRVLSMCMSVCPHDLPCMEAIVQRHDGLLVTVLWLWRSLVEMDAPCLLDILSANSASLELVCDLIHRCVRICSAQLLSTPAVYRMEGMAAMNVLEVLSNDSVFKGHVIEYATPLVLAILLGDRLELDFLFDVGDIDAEAMLLETGEQIGFARAKQAVGAEEPSLKRARLEQSEEDTSSVAVDAEARAAALLDVSELAWFQPVDLLDVEQPSMPVESMLLMVLTRCVANMHAHNARVEEADDKHLFLYSLHSWFDLCVRHADVLDANAASSEKSIEAELRSARATTPIFDALVYRCQEAMHARNPYITATLSKRTVLTDSGRFDRVDVMDATRKERHACAQSRLLGNLAYLAHLLAHVDERQLRFSHSRRFHRDQTAREAGARSVLDTQMSSSYFKVLPTDVPLLRGLEFRLRCRLNGQPLYVSESERDECERLEGVKDKRRTPWIK